MIHQIKPVVPVTGGEIWRALHSAREIAVGGIKWSFPHLRELDQNPRHRGLICLVVHEYHNSLSCQNHGAQGWPIFNAHGFYRGRVGILDNPGVLEGGYKVADGIIVGIANENSDDIVGVRLNPRIDGC